MTSVKDYYQVLGIGDNATPEQIKKAYRRLAKQHHPDRNPDNQQAAERFKEISEAHNVLGDPERRKQYDTMRKYGAFAQRSPRSPGDAGRADFDFTRGFEGFGGLGDIFSSIFGRGRKSDAPEPLEITVQVPFKVAALGGSVPVTVQTNEACPTCGGSGAAPGARVSVCSECQGRGMVTFGQGAFSVSRPCPACRGRGKVATESCTMCSGRGDMPVPRRLKVTVAAGTESGTKVRLKGQGQRAGGEPGDLIVTFDVKPDPFLRRQGLDLYCTVPINLAQAVLGTKIRVRTVDGRRVVLRVPPGTQPGRKFRIRGHGIERNGRRGDQYVEVEVKLPDKLSTEEERLFKAWAEAAGLTV